MPATAGHKYICRFYPLLQSILLSITSASTFILRRDDIEAVAQGEGDAAGIVVLHLSEHHAITIQCEAVDTTIEEIIARQFHVKTSLEEVLTDTECEYRVRAVEPYILLIVMSVHIEVGLQQPVVWHDNDVTQLERQHGMVETFFFADEL